MKKIKWLALCLFMTMLLVPMVMYAFFYSEPSAPKPPEPEPERSGVFEMEIALYRKKTDKVQNVNAYDYICGVVAAEMSADSETEALRAQAVAAFTYTVNKMEFADTHKDGAQVCDDYNHCKGYIPVGEAVKKIGEKSFKRISDAVYDTLGTVMTYGGAPINAVFHSISCGNTADASEVWGSEIPYLKSVACDDDKSAKNYQTKVTFAKSEFKRIFYDELGVTLSDDSDGWIGETAFFPSGYVDKVTVGGTEYAGTYIRKLFSLRSACFEIELDGDSVVFTVRGYGHGAGMSQSQANSMAKNGSTYEQILQYFYKDIQFEQYKI